VKAVFATDLSEASRVALECLCPCETEDFEEIVLLHVIDVDMYTEGGSVPMFLEADKRILEEQAEGLRAIGHSVRTQVEQGDAASQIERVVTQEGAGIVVVGSVGRGGLRDRALGSTAERVASQAKVPVLVEHVSDGTGSWCRIAAGHTFRRALVAVDFSPASARALEFVASLSGVEAVRLVHVAEGHDAAERDSSAVEARMRLDEWALGAAACGDLTTEVLEGEPAKTIGEAASAWGATCIATGLCGHSHLHRLVWGGVAAALVRSALVPVLLVPPKAEGEGEKVRE